FKDAGWNATVTNGGTGSFGFQASYSGNNATPADFVLNGVACSGNGSPEPTAPPAPAPAPAPAPQPPAGCTAAYTITNDWGSGFTANVQFTTPVALNNWMAAWTFAGNQQITNLWNGAVAQSGGSVQVRNASWNGTVAAGASAGFGFQAGYTGSNAKPAVVYVNGTPCAVQ
ncbi:MAG: cellulose-binding domain-containing protein, partial [Acidobacteria bacterium]|nr:cellulose-binding domain-containing protein [Acidobacteriota bacterium]